MPPAVAPEGDLVFRGKLSCFLTLLTCCYLHCDANWGVGCVILQQKAWKS
jgi:hypothetical protein